MPTLVSQIQAPSINVLGANQWTHGNSNETLNPIINDIGLLAASIDAINAGSVTLTEVQVGNGTVSLPSVTFSSDTDSGIYRIGSNNIGLTLGGTKSVDFGVNLTAITGALTVSTTAAILGIASFGSAAQLTISAAGALATSALISNTLATDSTTSTTGALLTAGGLGVAKAIFGGSTITATTTLNAGTLVLAGAGAVGAPSHSFTSTPTQGMYSVSATQVGFSNGAAGLNLVVDATGISTDSVKARVAIGTTPVGTVAIKEYSTGRNVVTELTLTNFIVGALAGAGAALGLGNIIYAFPAGQQLELVYSLSSLVLTCAGTAVVTDTGLGSVIAVGAVSVLDGTATFEDRLTGVAITTGAGGGAAVSSIAAATAGIGTGISINGTGAVKNIFLNSAGTWNANNTGNLTATGTIIIQWTKMS